MQKMFLIQLYTSSVKFLSLMKNPISLQNNKKERTMNNIFTIILVFFQKGLLFNWKIQLQRKPVHVHILLIPFVVSFGGSNLNN